MSIFNYNVDNILGGISTLSPINRAINKLEDSKNTYASTTRGLQRRPNTEKVLSDFDSPVEVLDAQSIIVKNSLEQKFQITFNGSLGITITKPPFEQGQGRIITTSHYVTQYDNPQKDIKTLKIGDKLLILNSTKTVQKIETNPSHTRNGENNYNTHIYVKNGEFDRRYEVFLEYNSTKYLIAAYETPKVDNVNAVGLTHNETITEFLFSGAVGTSSTSSKYIGGILNFDYIGNNIPINPAFFFKEGNVIIYNEQNNNNFSFYGLDGQDNNNMIVFTETVRTLEQLPKFAAKNTIVKVEGIETTNADDFYLRYIPTGVNTAQIPIEGIWEEYHSPKTIELDKTTLPVLIDLTALEVLMPGEGNTVIENGLIEEIDWEKRPVGDDNTNKEPSFVGKKIRDFNLFKNRLGLMVGDGYNFSENGNFFQFWKTTVRTDKATDRIVLDYVDNDFNELEYSVIHQENLLLFTNSTQVIITSDGQPFRNGTANFKIISNFKNDTNVRAISNNNRLYFVDNLGKNNKDIIIYEYFINSDGVFRINEINKEVRKEMLGTIKKILAYKNNVFFIMDTPYLTILSESADLWLYQFETDAQENTVLDSFHKWSILKGIEQIIHEGVLLFLFSRRTNFIDFDKEYIDNYLDDKIELTMPDVDVSPITSPPLPGQEPFIVTNIINGNTYVQAVASDIKTDDYYKIQGLREGGFVAISLSSNVGQSFLDVDTNIVQGNTVAGQLLSMEGSIFIPEYALYQFSLGGIQAGIDVLFGHEYDTEILLSKVILRDRNNFPLLDGRTQLLNIKVNHFETGFYDVELERPKRDPKTKRFNPIVSNSSLVPQLDNGLFNVKINRDNDTKIKIKSVNHYPLNVLGLNYKIDFSRGR